MIGAKREDSRECEGRFEQIPAYGTRFDQVRDRLAVDSEMYRSRNKWAGDGERERVFANAKTKRNESRIINLPSRLCLLFLEFV